MQPCSVRIETKDWKLHKNTKLVWRHQPRSCSICQRWSLSQLLRWSAAGPWKHFLGKKLPLRCIVSVVPTITFVVTTFPHWQGENRALLSDSKEKQVFSSSKVVPPAAFQSAHRHGKTLLSVMNPVVCQFLFVICSCPKKNFGKTSVRYLILTWKCAWKIKMSQTSFLIDWQLVK